MRRLALVPLLLAACAHGPAAPAKPAASAADFYPLQVGNSWSYDANRLGEKAKMEIKVLRSEGGAFVDSTGAELRVDSFGVRDQKRYLLRNPVEAGTKWTNVVSVQSVERYEILAADQPCDAPAGSFTGCVVVQSTNRIEEGKTLVNEMTFAPGVGIVRLEVTLDNKGQRIPQYSYTLAKYVLAPAGAQKP